MVLIQILLVSLLGGATGGLFGSSSGSVIVPSLVMLLGLDQKLATGSYIAAQILPIGLLGAGIYYRSNNLNITYALLIAFGMTIGNLLGSLFANQTVISNTTAKELSGFFLLILGLQYLGFGFLWNIIIMAPLIYFRRLWQSRIKHQQASQALHSSETQNLMVPTALPDNFVQECERELTDLVGPVASFLVQEAMRSAPQASSVELLKAIVKEIPESHAASRFERRLLKKGWIVDTSVRLANAD